jgi:hypothetical protein
MDQTTREGDAHRPDGGSRDHEVVVFDGRIEVARHRRYTEPQQRVTDPRHFEASSAAATTPKRSRAHRSAAASSCRCVGRRRYQPDPGGITGARSSRP